MITRHAIRANASTHPPNRPLPCLARRIWERSPFTCRTFPGQMPLHHSLLPIPRSRSSTQNQTFLKTVPFLYPYRQHLPSIHQIGPSRVWLPVFRPPGTEPSIPVSAQRTIGYQRLAPTRLVHSHQTVLRKCLILNALPDQSRTRCPE